MYNGIGILTPRGSGTSGHVQSNKFNLRRPPGGPQRSDAEAQPATADRKPNQDILAHNKKREIELKLLELADTLEEKGCVDAGGMRGRAHACGRMGQKACDAFRS